MKTIHWSMKNGSGMFNVAQSMARAELTLGVDSRVLDPFDPKQIGWEIALDADVHINHTHIPERIGKQSFRKSLTKPFRWVFPIHGTPEHVFENSVTDGANNGYGAGTSLLHHFHGMQQADAIVAFVPRHRDLYDLATDKHTIVDLVPMGMDHGYWQGGVSGGKYAGEPSFLTAENQHPFKWCVELLMCWPWVRQELDQSFLHCINIPTSLHRHIYPLIARYGSIYGAIAGSWTYDHNNLRNIFKSVDYYISPVRYGDFNRASLEAGAAGLKVISYPTNPYADYWMPPGDQRGMADALIRIGRGEVEPLKHLPIPTEREMAEKMIGIYERILERPATVFSVGGLPDALPIPVRQAIASATNIRLLDIPESSPLALVRDDVAAAGGA